MCLNYLGSIRILEVIVPRDTLPVDLGLVLHVLEQGVEEVRLLRGRLRVGFGVSVVIGTVAATCCLSGRHLR